MSHTDTLPRTDDLLSPDPDLLHALEQIAPGRVHARASDRLAYASTNRTCELGRSQATGHDYRHLLEVLDDVVH